MKQYVITLILGLYVSASGSLLYGWNNQHWLGNCERVVAWNDDGQADYIRLGVLRDGVYRVGAGDIALAFGMPTNSVLSRLAAGDFSLTCGTNVLAWATDGTNLFFYGEATDQLYAPENVYFLRTESGVQMASQPAPHDHFSGTNTWFMRHSSHRAEFLNVTAYFDRRSSNASIMNEPVFGFSLGDSWCHNVYCEFNAPLPGYANTAATNINLTVRAISYGDYGAAEDTHTLELLVEGTSCGTHSWDGEQKVAPAFAVSLSQVTNSQPLVRIGNPTVSEHFLLLDVHVEYPRLYEVTDEPLLCTGGAQGNLRVTGSGDSAAVMAWDISDPLNPRALDVNAVAESNGWSLVFGCGEHGDRYAVFEADSCYQPSLAGFRDVNWSEPGQIPSLVIVTPPRRWVGGFEEALEPLVRLRRAQGLGVRVVDAEEIYNAFSEGRVNPAAFREFCAAGVSEGNGRLRYLLFAGYASTDYKLEVFYPDTVFKNGQKGFPALFPLLQVLQVEPDFDAMLLLPDDLMLGDADQDGVPEVAVGRFLATDATELANMVAKTVGHDRNHPWNRAVIVGDWNGPPDFYYNFSGVCEDLRDDFDAAGWHTDYYYCASDTGFNLIWKNTYYETGLWYDLQEGRDFFYYLGHSSDTVMGHASSSGKYILNLSRMSAADWAYSPPALCMGCRMGRYTSLDVVGLSSCLMESAARNPSSAFSLLISSAGYMSFGDARVITELLSDEINLYGARRIGDAWTAAFDQFGAANLADVKHTVMLGDPSMPVYKPLYPTVIKLK